MFDVTNTRNISAISYRSLNLYNRYYKTIENINLAFKEVYIDINPLSAEQF